MVFVAVEADDAGLVSGFRDGGKNDPRSVRRPGRSDFVGVIVGELSFVGTVGFHHEQLVVAVAVAGEEDASPVGRPGRIEVVGAAHSELAHVGAVGPHRVEAVSSVAVAGEQDARSVRGPDRPCLVGVAAGQLAHARAVGVHHEDVAVVIGGAGEENLRAVRRESLRHDPVDAVVVGQLAQVGSVGSHHENLAVAQIGIVDSVAGEENLRAVRRPDRVPVVGGIVGQPHNGRLGIFGQWLRLDRLFRLFQLLRRRVLIGRFRVRFRF